MFNKTSWGNNVNAMISEKSKLAQLYTRGDVDKPSRPLTQVELQRRVNLIMLIDDAGGQTPMSKKLGTANTSYLSQQVSTSPHRVVNEKGARKLEAMLGLQHEWMDNPQTRIIYRSKSDKDEAYKLEEHPRVQINQSPQPYTSAVSSIDTQRLSDCLDLVMSKARHLPSDKMSKIVSVLYSSHTSGVSRGAMASALIELSSTN